jgi:predicted enzyme related to lactoylglutathione lyase
MACGYDVGVTLVIELTDGQHPENVGRFAGLSLDVDDIDAEHQRLSAAGVQFTHPPTRQPWGGTLAHFKDPAGNVLTLVSEAASRA